MSLIILDRDGVINHESTEYIKTPDEWHAISGSLKAIAVLNKEGFKVVVATNQSGVGRGLYDLSMLRKIHAKMQRETEAAGGYIADIFFCPHHPDDGCSCRKPRFGLFLQIHEKYAVEWQDVFFVGDSATDIRVAKELGCKPLLVLTGNGEQTRISCKDVPCFPDLAHAAEFIINEHRKKAFSAAG